MSTGEAEKARAKHISELVKVAPEGSFEIIAEEDRVRIAVEKEYTDEFMGKIITYLPLDAVKKAIPLEIDDMQVEAIRACGINAVLLASTVLEAKRALEEGQTEEADRRLQQAALLAERTSEACLLPEVKELAKVLEEKEEGEGEELVKKTAKKLGDRLIKLADELISGIIV